MIVFFHVCGIMSKTPCDQHFPCYNDKCFNKTKQKEQDSIN